MKGGAKVVIERHRHAGVFIAKGGKDSDALATRNMDPGHSVYGEKRIAVEVRTHNTSTLLRGMHACASMHGPKKEKRRSAQQLLAVLCCSRLVCVTFFRCADRD